MDKIRKMIRDIALREIKITTRWVEAVSVDWDRKRMTAKSVSTGMKYFKVLLGLGAINQKPVQGSRCLIGIIENKEAATFLIMASEVELIELNGAAHGELLIAAKLFAELDKEKGRIDGIITAIENGVPIAQDGGVGYQASMKTILAPIKDNKGVYNGGLLNETVKHG